MTGCRWRGSRDPLGADPGGLLTLIPTALVLKQPDLGTAILLVAGGGIVMFCAGVSWWYFIAVIRGCGGADLCRFRLARD